jgi:3-carboxy-cis,cis-muconate cycloisomerase
MPHKHNPVGSAVALAAALRVPGLLATLLSAMPQEHERGLGGWQAEWETVPELMRLASASARSIADVLEHLQVHEQRIGQNLALTRGLILSESLAVTLGREVGPDRARKIVEELCERAVDLRQPLFDIAAGDERVSRVLSSDVLRDVLSPASYLGRSEALVDEMLSAWRPPHPRNA